MGVTHPRPKGQFANNVSKPLKRYAKEKIDMIQNEFCIPLTYEQSEHFYGLRTESQVDQYAHDIILKGLKGD